MSRPRGLLASGLTTCLAIGALAWWSAGRADEHEKVSHEQIRKQIETRAKMNAILGSIANYEERHNELPTILSDMWGEEPNARRLYKDGWGRPFYYYRDRDHFVLISFGRAGKPKVQQVLGYPLEPDYDTNLVCIDGEFAQMPQNVDM